MSKFNAVRARWESTTHRGENSPTIPLLRNDENSSKITLPMDRQHKPHHTVPGPSKRLTSGFGGMFNKPITTIRNKAFSRASRHASDEMKNGTAGHRRQSLSVKSTGQSIMQSGKRPAKMERSKTMSFLPVPSKSTPRAAPPPPPVSTKPIKHAKAVSEIRIPTPPRVSFSRPSYLPRSTTHPSLGVAVVGGRRASEYNRRASGRWPPLEETRPLLRSPLLKSPMLRTPETDEDWFKVTSTPAREQENVNRYKHAPTSSSNLMWSALTTPRYPSISHKNKENSVSPLSSGYDYLSSPPRSPKVIRHHQLLQPIQPVTPPQTAYRNLSESMPLAYPSLTPLSPSRVVFDKRNNLERFPTLGLTPVPEQVSFTVDKAQPNAYWSGRFLSLNDKFLNECFDVESRPTDENDVDSSNDSKTSLAKSTHTKADQNNELHRAKRVFKALEQVCVTDEARRSLMIFRNMYALKTKMMELRVEIPPAHRADIKEEVMNSSVGSGGSAGFRKMSFMGRLRGRKSSGKSILSLRD